MHRSSVEPNSKLPIPDLDPIHLALNWPEGAEDQFAALFAKCLECEQAMCSCRTLKGQRGLCRRWAVMASRKIRLTSLP
ncbi:hypothetical protein DC3_39770 [Deinococcus cellulosilyticus NBRC 106333 = KACC 11606]|uniref:Uncharacterized protein n=1 Tax=Deinococcus cellulosilyticus (strain DSM 18568 / NBRC 106333 / KACC 11606 / 5516J-15) TaxID=1223518 RepID=A0A511N648_DEIC1|nr:hypothetical protein DC3_39770 [Deinococcus cellulosilyticus NBRC 106333 = KACC 11606]